MQRFIFSHSRDGDFFVEDEVSPSALIKEIDVGGAEGGGGRERRACVTSCPISPGIYPPWTAAGPDGRSGAGRCGRWRTGWCRWSSWSCRAARPPGHRPQRPAHTHTRSQGGGGHAWKLLYFSHILYLHIFFTVSGFDCFVLKLYQSFFLFWVFFFTH